MQYQAQSENAHANLGTDGSVVRDSRAIGDAGDRMRADARVLGDDIGRAMLLRQARPQGSSMSADRPVVRSCGCHTGKAVLWSCYALPLTLYAVIVLLAPPDVLDRLPWAKRAADGIHDWVLSKWSVFDIYSTRDQRLSRKLPCWLVHWGRLSLHSWRWP